MSISQPISINCSCIFCKIQLDIQIYEIKQKIKVLEQACSFIRDDMQEYGRFEYNAERLLELSLELHDLREKLETLESK